MSAIQMRTAKMTLLPVNSKHFKTTKKPSLVLFLSCNQKTHRRHITKAELDKVIAQLPPLAPSKRYLSLLNLFQRLMSITRLTLELKYKRNSAKVHKLKSKVAKTKIRKLVLRLNEPPNQNQS